MLVSYIGIYWDILGYIGIVGIVDIVDHYRPIVLIFLDDENPYTGYV